MLSPTAYLIPFSFQARSASPLWRPVIMGGTSPLGENPVALSIPTCFSHSWFQVISL